MSGSRGQLTCGSLDSGLITRWHLTCGHYLLGSGRLHRAAAFVLGLCIASVGLVARAVPPDPSDHALRTMCQRGLAESAAEYCRAQVNMVIEQAAPRARWAMRHMECQSQAALRITASDPTAKWQQVEKIESDYRREFPDDPRLPWLAWQLARAELLRSQQSLARWLATPASAAQREQALQSVRKVNSLLDTLEADLKERLPLSQNRTGRNPQATSRELQELRQDCELLRCESYLIRAKCYPNQSPDHLAALADVDSTATNVLRLAAADWSARDELLVAQAIAGLEVGKRRQALDHLIKTLLGQTSEAEPDTNANSAVAGPPSELARLRAGSALVEALCADDKPEQAAEFVKELVKNFNGPEVDLAALRVAIARMKQMPPNDRPRALADIVADTKVIGERYGGYWRNRSEALLIAEASSQPATGANGNANAVASNGSTKSDASTSTKEPKTDTDTQGTPKISVGSAMSELLAIEVRQLLAGGQTIAAITKLRSAITAAESAGRWEEAMRLGLETARLMQKEKQWIEAADLLAPLAKQHPEVKESAGAHALAAWCIAQSLATSGKQSTAPQAIEKQYEDLLRDQLAKWPDAPETIKAEEYLSAWLISKKRFDELSGMWLDRAVTVGENDRQRIALDQWLANLLIRVPKAKVTVQIESLAKLVTAGRLPLSERSAKITVIAAAMLTSPITQAEAEAMTGCKMPGQEMHQPPGDESLLSALWMLDAVYRIDLAAARNAAASLELAQLTSTVNLAWCKSIALAADELPESQIRNWSDIFERAQLPSDETAMTTAALKMTKLRLQQLRATKAGDDQTALASIKQLAQANANDPNLQLTLAAAIAQAIDDQPAQERAAEATKLVKRVAVGTKKDSEAHLRARWLEVRWQQGRGDNAATAQVAQLMLSSTNIQPTWWKTRFESIRN